MNVLSGWLVIVIAGVVSGAFPAISIAMGDHSASSRIDRNDRPKVGIEHPASAPEIAPGLLPGLLTVIGGGLLIIADRQRRRG